jgi:hypothetical protein
MIVTEAGLVSIQEETVGAFGNASISLSGFHLCKRT